MNETEMLTKREALKQLLFATLISIFLMALPIGIWILHNNYATPISNVHQHLNPHTDKNKELADLAREMQKAGVKESVLMQYGAGTEGGKEYEREKDRRVLEMAEDSKNFKDWESYYPSINFVPLMSAVYPNESDSADYVRENIGNYGGIGEVYVKNLYGDNINNLPNNSVMYEIYGILSEQKKPILIHYEPENDFEVQAMENAVRDFPKVNFIWAHSCGSPNTGKSYYDLALKYPNLYCEHEFYSWRSKEYKKLPKEVAKKSLIGTDSPLKSNVSQDYGDMIRHVRWYLVFLDKESREVLAHKNFERIFYEK